MAKSTTFDDRGLGSIASFLLVMMVVNAVVTIFYSWKLGLVNGAMTISLYFVVKGIMVQPANNPSAFTAWTRSRDRRRPVLLCLGDSIAHGTCSAPIPTAIPAKLRSVLGFPAPADDATSGSPFVDPVWVVNAGQNSITSHTILHERLNTALNVYPDYILIMIGTNDVQCMYNPTWARYIAGINGLPEIPTLHVLERNLTGILRFIQEASPKVEIGLCTLPPFGEDPQSTSNRLVRQANAVIERVAATAAAKEKVTLIPVFSELEAVLEKKRRGWTLPFDHWKLAFTVQNIIFQLGMLKSTSTLSPWNTLSKPFGFTVMSDGLHLNERGRDIVVDLVVEWMQRKNIAKAIAVKS